MDTVHELRRADGGTLLDNLRFARSVRTRTKGLLGRRSLAQGEGLGFREKSIHMLFMRMSLDIVFCDRDLTVVKVVHDIKPWRMTSCARASYVFEIGPGEAARLGIESGQQLEAAPPLA